jgi:branched-chain amino acid transport system ATP-binding protein
MLSSKGDRVSGTAARSDQTTLLEVRNVSQRFGSIAALNNISFKIGQNEIVGLIGPNGAGKTTLINAISGTQSDWTGDILFSGTSIRKLKPYKICHLGVSRTFQIAQPFEKMTTVENVMVGAMYGKGGAAISISAARRSAYEILDIVGLEPKATAAADALSVPERKLLEIARALSMRPKLLLLDEVMAGLNPTEVAQSCELINKIRDRNISILIIEHVMKAIVSVSDRIVVLQNGEKIMEGAPSAVIGDPKVVKAYLGVKFRGV